MASEELWVPPSASIRQHKKAPPPKMGEAFGVWAGQDYQYATLPGGGVIQFDLSRLTLADFRSMRDHYQINASLTVLSFMVHQIDWKIECEDKKIADFVEGNVRQVWTRLIRGISQAFWAGYSPMALQFENDPIERKIELTKVKDLVPESCVVNWKEVEGYAPYPHKPPKFKVYDGIKQSGLTWPIPPENSLWYPLLMENGDYYGKKLLRPAFPSWFFSILIHLFANRYFERFGEPLPIGRAPFDDEVEVNGKTVSGREAMEGVITALRSRAVVVMPSDRDENKQYDYDLEYLESQMRGADFERYLTRLDEEMSLGLFTPLLLLRVADVGSYNLGVGHMQMYLWMLNAIAGDIKEYIDKYICERLKAINFSPNAPRCQWVPRKMGKENVELIRGLMTELVRQGKVGPADLDELGQAAGLSLKEIREVQEDDSDPNDPQVDDRVGRPDKTSGDGPAGVGEPRETTRDISARLGPQITKAFRDGTFGNGFRPSLGYRRKFENALQAEGASPGTAYRLAEQFYSRVTAWMNDAIGLGPSAYSGPDEFNRMLTQVMEGEVDELIS